MHEKVNETAEENKKIIKKLIERLHEGEDPAKVKEEFKEVMKGLTPLQISQAEELLIKEGMPAEEMYHMCDAHLAVLEESLSDDINLAPEGHPINILMQEHTMVSKFANELRELALDIKDKQSFTEIVKKKWDKIISIVDHLKASKSHYLREENVLFSYLEKHGVTQPPKIMWMEHDKIRETEKGLFSLIDNKENSDFKDFTDKLYTNAHSLAELLVGHFAKENKILFPTALQVCSEKEWKEIREQFDEIGYCCFTPELPKLETIEEHKVPLAIKDDNLIDFGTGTLTIDQLKRIFEHLPIDITFVGKDDTVKFYSEGPKRVFVRTPSVIGRHVSNCHPNKSVDKVLEIVEGFKEKTLDTAEFWLEVGGRMIFIRYFPVRNKDGEYQGVLEVTQDITEIRKIEGEKRLL